MSIVGNPDQATILDNYREYKIDPKNIPQHIACVMDGNGRWAKSKAMARNDGHKAGAEALRRFLKSCVEFGVHYLSVYSFSTENWRRPKMEVSFLMSFFEKLLLQELPELDKQGVRIKVMGDRSELSKKLNENIDIAESQTQKNNVIQLNLMMNYGSRREIVQACENLCEAVKTGEISEISEEALADRLYTAGVPDPEIFVRPGGEFRVSNYMLWQSAYSELIFMDKLWPEFQRDDLIDILKMYQGRERRFGGLVS